MFKQRLFRLSGLLLILVLSSCAATSGPSASSASKAVASTPATSAPASAETTVLVSPSIAISSAEHAACKICEANARDARVKREQRDSVLRKLRLANDWHQQGRYLSAREAYEAILVEKVSPLSDAYALWGIINLHLDRDNPDYSREDARLVAHVLKQRARDAQLTEGAGEARMLVFAVDSLLVADVSKDNVVAENRRLRSELAQREEAIRRLRELTVGR